MIPALLALALQTAAPACTATVAPPAGLESWSKPVAISGYAGFTVGTATDIRLSDKASLPVAPSRPPAAGTFAGAIDFQVTTAGTYRVALSAAAWIDVVREGKTLTPVAHTEGVACSGIRKIVDFTLTPGRYSLQLAGAKQPAMRILIAPK